MFVIYIHVFSLIAPTSLSFSLILVNMISLAIAAAAVGTSLVRALPHDLQIPLIQSNPYTLPFGAPSNRSEALETTRQNFRYGPDIAGNGPAYPVGSLADEMIHAMNRSFFDEQLPWDVTVATDAGNAIFGITQVRLHPKFTIPG